jgi:hypothetical protein
MKYQLENNDSVTLSNVHPEGQCAGEFCTIHHKSDHLMRGWPQHWRSDRGIMERIDPWGGGHPDPDSPWPADSYEWVHGCVVNPVVPDAMICQPWTIDGVDATWLTTVIAVDRNGTLYELNTDTNELTELRPFG